MSCPGFWVTTESGTRICVPIYRAIPKWPFGPQPDPWFNDLIRLVALHDIVGELNDRPLRDTLSKAVQGAAGKLALPDGVAVDAGLFKATMPTAA